MNTVSLATTALSQTPSFWHAGADLLRSKSLDRNSYDSGDWFNTLDWTGQDNGFGHGLPLKGDNEAKWPYMKPLLANAGAQAGGLGRARRPSAQAQDLLRLRFSTPLFRLGSADAINAKVSFPASGTGDARDGVIAMRIDDTLGADTDPALRGLVVVFNASDEAVTQKVPGLAGASLALSPVQAQGSDPVVKTATWEHDDRLGERAGPHRGGVRPALRSSAREALRRSARRRCRRGSPGSRRPPRPPGSGASRGEGPRTVWWTVTACRAAAESPASSQSGPPRSTVSGSMTSWPPRAVTVPVARTVTVRPSSDAVRRTPALPPPAAYSCTPPPT